MQIIVIVQGETYESKVEMMEQKDKQSIIDGMYGLMPDIAQFKMELTNGDTFFLPKEAARNAIFLVK